MSLPAKTDAPTEGGTRRFFAGAGLAVIPATVFVLCAALMLPRAAPPDEVPLPAVDRARLHALQAAEQTLAREAEASGLSDDARALGSELRAYHAMQVRGAPRAEQSEAKVRVEKARALLVAREGLEGLNKLFVVQQEHFLRELSRWERDGAREDSVAQRAERDELGGVYLQRLRDAGWADETSTRLSVDETRVLYKMMWGTDVGLDGEGPFALEPNERRVLYGLFLRAPHPPELLQATLRATRERARTQEDCRIAEREIGRATARWRIAKISALAEFAPEYPKHYAIGVAQLEGGDYAAAAEAFRTALDTSPDGPYALRSRNMLKYAMNHLPR